MQLGIYSVLAALLAMVIVLVAPGKKDFLGDSRSIIIRMPEGIYGELSEFCSSGGEADERRFWARSEGAKGLLKRIHGSLLCIQLIQNFRKENLVTKSDSRRVWGKLFRQCIYTALALPEAAICHFVDDAHHIAAREATHYHCQILLRTQTLCITEDTPECLLILSKKL